MRTRASWVAILVYGVVGHPRPAVAQVDQQRAQAFFKEAQALCARDGGRLWGGSLCAPRVIGDARTQTFATSQPPPAAPRPRGVRYVNAPTPWGGVTWIASTWEGLANSPPWSGTRYCSSRCSTECSGGSAWAWGSWRMNRSTHSTGVIGCSSNGARSRGR